MGMINTMHGNSLRTFLFIDGNNLICRFQEVLKQKVKKDKINEKDFLNDSSIILEKDSFLWKKNMNIVFPQLSHIRYEIVRAYYYTYCNEKKVKEMRKKISDTSIIGSEPVLKLTSEIITRNKSEQAKGDDIKICLDSIRHASNNSADVIYLFSGDGDFLPLVEELQKMGKYVFVAAFDYIGNDKDYKKATGLNIKLKERADYFLNLSLIFGLPK